MFLSKDFLEGDFSGPGTAAGPPWGSLPTPSSPSVSGSPLQDGFGSRAGTPMGGPRSRSAAASLGHGQGEEDAESTPTSAASLRQKMLQQRQRALQKQRTATGLSSGTMVMANESLPAAEVLASPTAAAKGPPGKQQANDANGANGANSASGARCLPPGVSPDSPSAAILERAMSRMSMDEEESANDVVMQDPTYVENKEEEARRRTSLQQELDERGISHVYDPSSGPSTPPGKQEMAFDVGSVAPADMKNFLLNPVPKNAGMLQCRIIRERTGLNKIYPKYFLESDCGIFMMLAKKEKHNKTSNYSMSMSRWDNCDKESDSFLGKLRANFLGLEFVAYGAGLNPKKIDPGMSQVHAMQMARQELLAVQYSSSLWGSKPRGPRKMGVVVPRVQGNGERLVCRTLHPDTEGLVALQKSGNATHLVDVFQNKPPKWNEQIGAFVLNFNKRVTQASVKNFQLCNVEDPDTVYLQFGKVGKDVFNVDFRFPFSPLQAFAICLSSFDYKLCCE